jgi:DNA-binding transcriptional ArsR family regulator
MLTNEQKAYIKDNQYDLSLTEIATALGVTWRDVNAYLKVLRDEAKIVKPGFFNVDEFDDWVIPQTKMSDYREAMNTYYRLNDPKTKLLIGYIDCPSNLKPEESPEVIAFINSTGVTPIFKKVNSRAYGDWRKWTEN